MDTDSETTLRVHTVLELQKPLQMFCPVSKAWPEPEYARTELTKFNAHTK